MDLPLETFEHAGADVIDKKMNTTNPLAYSPTPEEQKAKQLVDKLFEKAKKHKKQYDQHWLSDYKMFRGKQWTEQRPSYRHSEVINMIFQNIQASVPLLSDSRPRIEFVPQKPSGTQLAQILNQVVQYDWEDQNWLYQLVEQIYEAHFYGTSFGAMEFDPKARFGIGSICYESADPFYCFPDPQARNINDKRGKYFIYAEPIDVDALKAEYPDKGKYLKPDLIDLMPGSKTDLDAVHFKSPVDNRVIMEGVSQYDFEGKNQCLKITAYILSDETIEEELGASIDDPAQGNQPDSPAPKPQYVEKKKYPNGRKICMASGIVLDDGDIPYEDGKFPYAKLINYPLPREFWGQSEIEQLRSPQKIFNKMVCFALDVLTLMGNPVWVVDTTSGVDTDNLFNRPGLVLETEPGARVERMPGVELQPFVLPFIDRMKSWFDGIQGSSDLSRGVEPKDVTAASAIEALQEVAQTRTRQKSRMIDAFLQDLGQLYLSRVFQFYSSPRVFQITDEQDVKNYFKFHVETVRDEAGNDILGDDGKPKRVARVRGYQQDAEGNYFEEPEERQYEIESDFAVKVSTGSSLPFARVQRTSESMNLFKMGVIDDEELLKNLQYPNYEAVLQRTRQKRAQAQQEAMQMKAMQTGMGGGASQPAPVGV